MQFCAHTKSDPDGNPRPESEWEPLFSEDCWAKTNEDGIPCLSVKDHCTVVGEVARILFSSLSRSVASVLPAGSVSLVASHDIGKLTPGFQLKAVRWIWYAKLKHSIIADGLCSNHAIVSQWHLQNSSSFQSDKKRQYWLTSTGGHHGRYSCGCKNLKQAPYEGGDQRFIKLREELLEFLIERFGPLPVEVAKKEHERIHLLTGFTIFSDWIGSNSDWFPYDISTDSKTLATTAQHALDEINWTVKIRPNLSFGEQFQDPKNPVQIHPRPIQIALHDAADAPGLYIVEAPMGMGKTEAALATAYRRWTDGDERGLYFALPTQLTSNKIHERINQFLTNVLGEESTQTLIHGNAWLADKSTRQVVPAWNEADPAHPENEHNEVNEALRWYSSTRKQLIAPFGTGTIDQALLSVLPARFAALRYFALAGKVVVIDEVHSFDPYMAVLIDRLIRYLIKAGSTVIILSATLTSQRRAELVQAAGATENETIEAYPLITKVATGDALAKHIPVPAPGAGQSISLKHETLTPEREEKFWESIADKVEKGANVVVIRNSVALAQNTYRDLKSRISSHIPPEHIGLIHSRFPQIERDCNEAYWTSILGKEDKRRPQGSLLVATQIVEQSVDIDADCLITDLAPTELILQRVGRLHRHPRKRPDGFEQAVCYILHPATDWQGETNTIKSALNPHHWIYPPLSLWQASMTLKPLHQIDLPKDIRPLLERSASLKTPKASSGRALAKFEEEADSENQAMRGTANLRDVFNAAAIEDTEGIETRYGIKPTANLIILPKPPVEQSGRVTWLLPNGETRTTRIGEFDYPLAKALRQHATRIPAYLVRERLRSAPSWLSLHIDSAVLAMPTDDSTELILYPDPTANHTLYYRKDLGVTFQKNETVFEQTEPEDFWF